VINRLKGILEGIEKEKSEKEKDEEEEEGGWSDVPRWQAVSRFEAKNWVCQIELQL
jgi:hypothetical protein